MRVDVLLAIALGVAVEQVFDAVDEAPQPAAVNHVFDFIAVGNQHLQQVTQIWRSPVAGDIAFGKTDVTRAQCGAAGVPVVQVQAGQRRLARAETLHRTARQMNRQGAVPQAQQQLQGGACSTRRIFWQGKRLNGGYEWHGL